MATTRTIGPLHFEDLEPKRFEDLVRQLAYDFKQWSKLEATGRSGSDDGFDARGYESTGEPNPQVDDSESDAPVPSRLWLVQCKRERTITPKKLAGYLAETKLDSDETLYGIIFAAASDFSKASRNVVRDFCAAHKIEEWHVWGKAELEDMLFQPKNDPLLFAYFGLSLSIRRRSARSTIGARLATKRRANNVLEGKRHASILIRDVSADWYPEPDEMHATKPSWITAKYAQLRHDGLAFVVQRHFAYIGDDGTSWDAALVVNDNGSDPWSKEVDQTLRNEVWKWWSDLPETNRAWMEVLGLVPFEKVLAIDEIGDEIVGEPHVYADFSGEHGPFSGFGVHLEGAFGWDRREFWVSSQADRIKKFKPEWRMVEERTAYVPRSFFGA